MNSRPTKLLSLPADNQPVWAEYAPQHFGWTLDSGVAQVTLNRPERKNPLTFESYAELRSLFQALHHTSEVKVVVLRGAGGNFCSGGDVFEIIGPLVEAGMPSLLNFTHPDRRSGAGHPDLPAADHRRCGRGVRWSGRDPGDGR